MQLTQGARRDARSSELHCGADAGIEHPLRQHRDYAGFNLNVNDPTASALFAVESPYGPTVEGMPRVVDFNVSPDMGRMTA